MSWWQYLLLVNIYLVLFYGFYALLLRKETFFQLNRVYLVSAAALSFFIPVMQADWVQNLFITQEIKYTVYGNPVLITQLVPVKDAPVNIGQILAVIYIAGVVILFGRLIWQLVVLNRMIKKDRHDSAYSFFNKIKLPDEVKDNNIVALHEQVHARQWHSVDVFVIEAVMIVNWFNPVVYFYRRAIKHIHEFIADDQATKQAANKAEYAMLLLTQTFNVPSHNLVNSFFNHSLLKQRVIMLQKDKSQRIKLIKYGLSAPLFMLMLILTSSTVNNSKAIKNINDKVTQVLLLPPTTEILTNHRNLKSTPASKALIVTRKISKDNIVSLQIDTNKSQIFTAVEKEPEFIGGQEKFNQFISDNIKYPQDMIANNISGRSIITFVVEADGSVSGVRALRGPSTTANEEAVKVIKLTSSKWMPGYQNHAYVRVQFTVPVDFNTGVKVIGYKSQTDTGKIDAVYIVDGKQLSNADAQVFLKNSNNIMSVNVKKDPLNKAKGIVEILTFDRPGQSFFVDGKQVSTADARAILKSNGYHNTSYRTDPSDPDKNMVEISTKKPIDMMLAPAGKNDPLFIVDGKEMKKEDVKALKPEDIQSMSVNKGQSAVDKYGEKAVNGVIVITTKAAIKKAQSTDG